MNIIELIESLQEDAEQMTEAQRESPIFYQVITKEHYESTHHIQVKDTKWEEFVDGLEGQFADCASRWVFDLEI